MAERLQRLLVGGSGRDRFLVATAIILGTVVLLYVALLDPLSAARRSSADRLAERTAVLRWLNERAAEAMALRGPSGAKRARDVDRPASIADVEASLDGRRLRPSLTHLAPRPGKRFDARFEDVPYTSLVAWLAESHRRLGVTVTRIVIEATGRPDRVNAELTATLTLETE